MLTSIHVGLSSDNTKLDNTTGLYIFDFCQQTDAVFEAGKAAKLLMNKYVYQAYCALSLYCTTELGLQTMLCECKHYIHVRHVV